MGRNTIVYSRVSTDKQEMAQQMRTVNEWLSRNNLTASAVIDDEGVSGGVSYKDRKLGKEVLPMLEHGDTLVVAELSRLGRSMSDINKLVNDDLKPRGIRLVIVQMGLDLDCAHMKAIDEMILFAFSFAAQMEKELIQERTQSAIDVRKGELAKHGQFVSKSGRVCTRLGNPTDEGLERARAASAEKRRQECKNDPAHQKVWEIVIKHAENDGMTFAQASAAAIELMNAGLTTSTGKPFNTKRARDTYHTMKAYMQ